MPSQKFELSDINTSQTNLTGLREDRSGCRVSALAGFVFLMLAAAVAVGVGIIVHFAGGNREVVCRCDPETVLGGQISECLKLASLGHTEICEKCPAKTSATTTTSAPVSTTATSPTHQSATATTTTTTTTAKPTITDVRIPTDLYPEHYNVEIQTFMVGPDPHNFTFKGYVKIWLKCVVATDNVTLHVNVLTVDPDSIRFYGDFSGYTTPTYSAWIEDKDRQFIILKLSGKTEVGRRYIAEMNYTSPLKDDLNGLYLSSYSRNGQPVYLATTQFQPTDARKAFPCYDEPAIKSTFNITLVRPSHLISISNMPIIDNSTTITEGGITYVKDVYAQTQKMSTYLLAFIVCDFSFTHNTTRNGVLYRAWSRPEAVSSTEYALGVGIKILTYFEDFFNVTFPLPKQDMIAIPDFAAGAMENWGLITYRETAMLYTPGVSNEANKERVAIVVSHELAHQWFGDLVSPRWWDDLWLNEGFASFVEYLGVDYVHPKWKMFDKFALSEIQDAFSFDGLVSSHPLYVPVGHPDEINEIFDSISYAKGASVIRMMRHFLGYETFRKGMNLYLTTKQYDAAFHDDLWEALTEQARRDNKNINVKEIMDTWTLQMNFPVVTVTQVFGSADGIIVQQERYLQNPAAPEQGKYVSPFNYTWNIPLTFTTSLTKNFNQTDENVHWLWRNETSKLIRLAESLPPNNLNTSWIICNVQQNGYYRVHYQVSNWQALARQLKGDHRVIPAINRAQLINDAWNLAKSEMLDIEVAFFIIDYLENEREYVPWQAARLELSYVSRMLAVSSIYGSFQTFMREKLNDSYQYFGLNNTGSSHTEVAARGLIASEACKYGIRECLDAASAQYRRWMETPEVNPIDPNLRPVVYCYAIRAGGAQEWNFGLKMYKESDVATEKVNLLSALSCSNEPWILNNFMQLILEELSPIRKQDALSVISYVTGNVIGRSLAWNFFRGNFIKLKESFGSSFFQWSNLIDAVTRSFNTAFELEELKAFRAIQDGNFGSGERSIIQATEKVESNIKWMKNNYKKISSWLSANGY
ncbi:hypothetical protein Btru_039351 [Bulinus truncatus]|nr:hypothetical protein Btru_039351 [Bulinus truncatus]